MHDIYDLGGTPANEACAQLGHTNEFARLNRLEVECYAAAIKARFGVPPDGCSLVVLTNRHDFGTYRTLGLKVWHVARDRDDVEAYVTAVEDGLGSWIEAGFTAPVTYDDDTALAPRTLEEVILGAIMTTRPDPSGVFPIRDFALLHDNLSLAYPRIADEARVRIEGISA